MPRRDETGTPTRYPGIRRLPDGYWIRAKIKLRTGQTRQGERILPGASLAAAVAARQDLVESLRAAATSEVPGTRPRLDDFGAFWIRSKRASVDPHTLRRYADILDLHILPTIGQMHVDTIRPADVQALVNTWTESDASRHTVRGWYRVLRLILRDAVAQLELDRDPTMRVKLPPAPEADGSNAITAEQLAKFLGAMRERFSSDHAIAAAPAFTGLRHCHVAGLKWEDVDEDRGVLHIRRRAYLGTIGPVSRRKRAPKVTPLDPLLAEILREHRGRLIRSQARGLEEGWVFPSRKGIPRRPDALAYAWRICAAEAGITDRFTPHGLRRTFHDLTRAGRVPPEVVKALVGHVTDTQHERYSSVGLDEMRAAVGQVVKLVSGADRGCGPDKPKKRK